MLLTLSQLNGYNDKVEGVLVVLNRRRDIEEENNGKS